MGKEEKEGVVQEAESGEKPGMGGSGSIGGSVARAVGEWRQTEQRRVQAWRVTSDSRMSSSLSLQPLFFNKWFYL